MSIPRLALPVTAAARVLELSAAQTRNLLATGVLRPADWYTGKTPRVDAESVAEIASRAMLEVTPHGAPVKPADAGAVAFGLNELAKDNREANDRTHSGCAGPFHRCYPVSELTSQRAAGGWWPIGVASAEALIGRALLAAPSGVIIQVWRITGYRLHAEDGPRLLAFDLAPPLPEQLVAYEQKRFRPQQGPLFNYLP